MRVTYNKEIDDTILLSKKIEESGWMDKQTILVCCAPDLSSLNCQVINQTISRDELYDMIFMEMPSPWSPQILNRYTGEVEVWDRYMVSYIARLDKNYKYLFINGVIMEGKEMNRVAQCIRSKDIDARYAALYIGQQSLFKPDFSVETVDRVEYAWKRR